MRVFKILFFFAIFPICLIAQKDQEAQKVLDAFSKKTKSFKSYIAKFSIKSENKQNSDQFDSEGTILVMGNKYKLSMNQTDVYFDGKNIYNYSLKSNEVSISLPSKKDDENFLNNPSKLFNLYTKDFKYRLVGNTTMKNRDCYEVDLYPNDLNRKYSIVKLLIDSENYELVAAKLIMKAGITYTLTILEFNADAKATDKDFILNPSLYKGIEVIDLR